MMALFLAALFGAAFVGVRADLPVHCLRHQMLGEWEFTLSGLSSSRSSCGHRRPDVEEYQPQGIDSPKETKKITLSEPSTVTSDGATGTFTVIYDEGFEAKIADLTFFAFNRFDFSSPGQSNATENARRSHCGETSRGWYRKSSSRKEWGCYVAKKVNQPTSFIEIQPSAPYLAPGYDEPKMLDWHTERVKKINLMQLSWKASVYDRFVGKTMRELNSYAGIQRSERPTKTTPSASRIRNFLELVKEDTAKDDCPESAAPRRAKPDDVLPRMLLKGQRGPKPCQLRRQVEKFGVAEDPAMVAAEKSLPTELDWRKASHKGGGVRDFLEPVMDQSDCGSCYVVSTTRMLTSRHKVATNDTTHESFSISFPLHCNEYNQGCKGGYGFLASKWSEDVGLLPASCAPYKTSGSCSVTCDPKKLEKRYRASGHKYLGGWYGNSSVVPMMLELHNNGPMVVSFEPSDDFMFYSGGIFSMSTLGTPAPLFASHSEWQKVDHAVLLVGWGEDMGQKYWLVQNSWGLDWGEGGYFRIVRGINDSGLESQAEHAQVVEDENREVLEDFIAQTA